MYTLRFGKLGEHDDQYDGSRYRKHNTVSVVAEMLSPAFFQEMCEVFRGASL